MKSKETLKELVETRIIYAALLVCYCWMWARRDWHDYYMIIQYVVCGFTILFFAMQANRIRKYSKEERDEMAIQNLRRTDAISLKIMTAAAVVIALVCGLECIDGRMAGYALVGMIFVLTVVRFITFCEMEG